MRLFATLILTLIPYLGQGQDSSPRVNEFPFQSKEGLIWIQVNTPKSPKPLNFLVDSGAGVSVVALDVAQQLGLKLGHRVNVRGVGTATKGYWPQHIAASVGDVRLPEDYLAVDLSNLSRACTFGVDGLLGADFFATHVVQIDFKAQIIRLLKSSTPDTESEVVPLEFRSCGLRLPIRVNGGKPQWVRLDTGCATALQWVTSKVDFKNCSRQPAIGMDVLSIPMTQTTVHLGRSDFIAVPTGLHAKEIFAGEAGLLGNGLLSRYARVTIDAAEGRLVLEKELVSH